MNKIEWFQYHFSNEYNLVMKFKILFLIHLSLSQLDRHQKLNTTIIFKICFRILWNINLVSKSQILHFLHKLIVCLLSHPSYKAGCFFCSPLFESEGNNERFIVWAGGEWYIPKQTWNIEKRKSAGPKPNRIFCLSLHFWKWSSPILDNPWPVYFLTHFLFCLKEDASSNFLLHGPGAVSSVCLPVKSSAVIIFQEAVLPDVS